MPKLNKPPSTPSAQPQPKKPGAAKQPPAQQPKSSATSSGSATGNTKAAQTHQPSNKAAGPAQSAKQGTKTAGIASTAAQTPIAGQTAAGATPKQAPQGPQDSAGAIAGANTAPKPQPGKRSLQSVKTANRPVVYDEIKVKLAVGPKAITEADAKKILGWQEESENVAFGAAYLLMDTDGKKVRCHNNSRNRPFQLALAKTWQAEVLRGNWRFTGETLIIGRTGITISAQHRLVGLVLAVQLWRKNPDRWPFWKTEPTMEGLLVMGVSEADDVVNVIDTGKPRTLRDVIFRSETFAKVATDKEREKLANRTANAIKMLWDRTGAKEHAYAPTRTHAESLSFLARHPRLLDCVRHIHEEDSEGLITKFVSPGYASALLYLMGSANSERLYPADSPKFPGYYDTDQPSEHQLDWALWDKAQEFFVLMASENELLAGLRDALAELLEDRGQASWQERVVLTVKAWNLFKADDPVNAKDLKLVYRRADDDTLHIDENPGVGGVDLGRFL